MPRPKLRDAPLTGAFEEERRLPDGRRQIQLRDRERRDIQFTRLVEGAAALFLDLDDKHTWAQIAEELGISLSKLKDITKSEQFDEAYNQLLADISHDPRYRATQAQLADMLPLATKRLRTLLESNDTPATVQLNAIRLVYEKGGIEAPDEVISDRRRLAEFLGKHNISTGTPIDIPIDYGEALERFGVEIVDAEFRETEEE